MRSVRIDGKTEHDFERPIGHISEGRDGTYISTENVPGVSQQDHPEAIVIDVKELPPEMRYLIIREMRY